MNLNQSDKCKKKISIETKFLIISLFFGVVFSLVFPVFYEGDGQFHFDYCSYQADVVINREEIGSKATFGYDEEMQAIKEKRYYGHYFKTKVKTIPRDQVNDERAANARSLSNDIMHFFPSVGLYIGYHIYPSIGVMVITARLVMIIVYSISIYYLIKKISYGKNLLFLTACTPVMMIEGYSLSYDALSFILTGALIVAQINYIYCKEGSVRYVLFFSLVVGLFTKDNMKITLLLSLLILMDKLIKVDKLWVFLKKHKKSIAFLGLITIIGIYMLFAMRNGGIKNFSMRMANTFLSISNKQYTRGLLLGIVGDYTASYSLPDWCLYGYAIVFFLAIFGETKPKVSPLFAYVGAGVFFANILGTTGLYNTFSNSSRQPEDITQTIGGQLGRYYTPLLPYLLFLQNCFGFKLSLNRNTLENIVVGWTVFCLVLLVIITIYFCYILKIPAAL